MTRGREAQGFECPSTWGSYPVRAVGGLVGMKKRLVVKTIQRKNTEKHGKTWKKDVASLKGMHFAFGQEVCDGKKHMSNLHRVVVR